MVKKTKPKVVVSAKIDERILKVLKDRRINISRTVSDYLESIAKGLK